MFWGEIQRSMDREVCSVVLKRWGIIESLREESQDKRELVDSVSSSRSTVNRATRELESMGVVEYGEGEYVVTPLGRTIADGFNQVMESVELRLELEPFLRWIPNNQRDFELQQLADAELFLPEPGDPWAMVNRHVTVLGQTDDIRCVLPLVGLHGHEAAYEQIVEAGARGEIVAQPEVVETMKTNPSYAELTKEMAETGRFQMYQYDGQIPYFVGLLDNIVQIGVDEDGEPRALVETRDPNAREWAANKIEEYKQQADTVEIASEATKVRS